MISLQAWNRTLTTYLRELSSLPRETIYCWYFDVFFL